MIVFYVFYLQSNVFIIYHVNTSACAMIRNRNPFVTQKLLLVL